MFDEDALTILYRMPGYNFSPSMEDGYYFLPYNLTNVYKKAQIKNRPVWPSLARTSSRLFVARNPLKDCHLRKAGPAISKRSLPALHSFLLPFVTLLQSCAFISICMLDFLVACGIFWPRHAFYKNFDWNAFETLKWQPEIERMWGDVSRCCRYILSWELKDHGMVLRFLPS